MPIVEEGISRGQRFGLLAEVGCSLLLVLFFTFSAAHANALNSCLSYDYGGVATPVKIRPLMSRFGDEFAEVCLTPQGTVSRYYSVTASWLDHLSVCHYQKIERDLGNGRKAGDVFEYMRLSRSGSCSPPTVPDYVEVSGASPGVFAMLQRFWNQLGTSESRLDSAIGGLPKEEKETPAFSKIYDAFRTSNGTLPLRRLFLAPSYPGVVRTGYVLEGPKENNRAVVLYVDVTADGPVVFAAGLLVE